MLDKLFYFIINFARKRDTATAVANYSGHGYAKKKNNNNKKNTAIQEKLQLHTTSCWTKQGTSTITF